jgi:hypothetical protein
MPVIYDYMISDGQNNLRHIPFIDQVWFAIKNHNPHIM